METINGRSEELERVVEFGLSARGAKVPARLTTLAEWRLGDRQWRLNRALWARMEPGGEWRRVVWGSGRVASV